MKDYQWELIKKCARCEEVDSVPAGMIVDSPWIPGYCKVSTLDYYTDLPTWLSCYKRIKNDFPNMLLLPDYWVEMGMAAEPSSFGCKVLFSHDKPVMIGHLIEDVDDLDRIADIAVPNPQNDGLMPLVINYYKRAQGILREQGEAIRIVATRGPLNIATFLMSVSEFCMAVKIDPENTHKVLRTTTELCIRWLKAQMDAIEGVEGILVLDDICGFLSEADYKEFAHPYLKKIFDSFNVPVKVFHTDNFNNRYVTFPYISDLGVNIFNFSHQADMKEARKWLGEKVCIFGNVPPLDILTNGTPDDAYKAAIDCLNSYGSKAGIILSAGGGASSGMSKENCSAFLKALDDWNEIQ